MRKMIDCYEEFYCDVCGQMTPYLYFISDMKPECCYECFIKKD